MTALVLRWREVPPVLWRWRGPAAMASAVTRRQPAAIATIVGASAKSSMGFGYVGPVEAAEELPGMTSDGDATFLSVKWRVKTAPAADATFTASKNGAAWANVTIPAGETSGVTALDDGEVGDGDLIDWTAPDPADVALRGFYPTLSTDPAP